MPSSTTWSATGSRVDSRALAHGARAIIPDSVGFQVLKDTKQQYSPADDNENFPCVPYGKDDFNDPICDHDIQPGDYTCCADNVRASLLFSNLLHFYRFAAAASSAYSTSTTTATMYAPK